jgi:hypothetical protein
LRPLRNNRCVLRLRGGCFASETAVRLFQVRVRHLIRKCLKNIRWGF